MGVGLFLFLLVDVEQPIRSVGPSMKIALITGSAGLVGSETVAFLVRKGFFIVGIDNDMRSYFFGQEASTKWKLRELKNKHKKKYSNYAIDIRDSNALEKLFKKYKFQLIVHTAAQPSHDWAAKEPLTDFGINAQGTMNLLELYRRYCPKATFIFTSTNKVYGDTPNALPLVELEKRFEISAKHPFSNGINESMSIDNCKHSIFGASKVAADIMVQEYGKYFGLNTAVFRCGCITGPAHSGTQLHGFLSYLVKSIANEKPYTVFGYKGKQVRDNIHSHDLVNMFWNYHQNPKEKGVVYNAGGGRYANVSMLEAIEKIEKITGKKAIVSYNPENRIGDHIWYVSNLSKFKSHYPDWKPAYNIDKTIREIYLQIKES